MSQLVKAIRELAGEVSGEADLLLPAAADEHAGEPPKVRKVRYTAPPSVRDDRTAATAPRPKLEVDSAGKQWQGFSDHSRRTCSICRKPGHRAPTCPERYAKERGR